MKIRRWSAAGIIAAALLTPVLVACGDGSGDASTSASPSSAIPADPKEALLASTKEISKGNFRLAITGHESTSSGVIHAPSKSAQLLVKMGDAAGDFSMEMELILIEPESWVKTKFGGKMMEMVPNINKLNVDKYQHLDRSKVADVDELQFDLNDLDPAASEKVLKGIVDVKKTSEGTYQGTLDVSAGAEDSMAFDDELVKALGDKGKTLPFTAKLDAQGRLTELAFQMPVAGETPAHEIKISYSDYGTVTGVQKPAADQVVEASDDLYEMFNS